MSHTLHQELVELRGQAMAWLTTGCERGFDSMIGICGNVCLGETEFAALGDLMEKWPAGSGDRHYPVQDMDMDGDPQESYQNSTAQEMWNPKHEYARNRWDLLEWLIEQTASETDQ